MIRRCAKNEFEHIYAIINDGAHAYNGVIPADCWAEPYMRVDELQHEIDAGVMFWCSEEGGALCAVMGLQNVRDVTLIRHAYVLSAYQRQGIGAQLLSHLRTLARSPILIGTWAAALWAIRFYEKHGFRVVGPKQKEYLLERYWNVPERQAEVSVVLADSAWQEPKAEDRASHAKVGFHFCLTDEPSQVQEVFCGGRDVTSHFALIPIRQRRVATTQEK